MDEAKKVIWAGFDVGKGSFVAALDQETANGRRKVTSLPCRKFNLNQDEVEKFFHWAQELSPQTILGIDGEIEKAVKWLRKAAEQGDERARLCLENDARVCDYK